LHFDSTASLTVSNAFTPNSKSAFTAAYIGNMNWRANLSLRATIASNLIQIAYRSALPFKNILDATKQWDALSKAVMNATVDTLGHSARRHQDWFDSNDAEIQKLLNERNTAFAAIFQSLLQSSSTADGPCANHDCKKDILSLWAEHLEDLLNQTNPVDPSIIDQLPKVPSVP